MRYSIILAAGGSSRLGQPKQLLPWNDDSLLSHSIKTVWQAGSQTNVVVLGAYCEEIVRQTSSQLKEDQITKLGSVEFIYNATWQSGMASSLRLGIDAIRTRLKAGDATLVTLCDMPLIEPEHYATLFQYVESAEHQAAATRYPSGVGVPACFSAESLGSLISSGEHGAKMWLRSQPEGLVAAVFCQAAMRDIDSPADMQSFRA